MKTLRTIIIAAALALSLSGCDFFRSLVGKPTSAELEQMKIEIQKKAEREKFVADSIKAAREAEEMAARAEEEIPAVSEDDPRFHVIIGCFREQENAVNLREALIKQGYEPKRIVFKNGYDVVSIIRDDNYWKAQTAMELFMESPYCPDDVWIYDMNENLHVK